MNVKTIINLASSFPNGFINHNFEFIAKLPENDFFSLKDCKTDLDVKCKVLEWFSRSAFKGQFHHSKRKNEAYHKYMLDGINHFCGTHFTFEEIETVYVYLGNRIRHSLTVKFIESNYEMNVLLESEKNSTP